MNKAKVNTEQVKALQQKWTYQTNASKFESILWKGNHDVLEQPIDTSLLKQHQHCEYIYSFCQSF